MVLRRSKRLSYMSEKQSDLRASCKTPRMKMLEAKSELNVKLILVAWREGLAYP
jgi:hypothetical protein